MTPLDVLRDTFGYKSFRPMQEDVIETILEGRDCLVLMPTGGGKSLCFQVPALVKDGVCIVISPLVALMKDQVEGLRQNGVAAAFINSTQSQDEQNNVARLVKNGEVKIVYVSPEKLQSDRFQMFLEQQNISMFAIDEAHCVSFWGHDFRPEYNMLGILKKKWKNTPIIALTATADRLTRQDILTQLGLHDPQTFISSFDRPNLRLEVRPGVNRYKEILKFLDKHPRQAGIIYCLSRKSTESMADKLNAEGFKAAAYHAGLALGERNRVQEGFLKDNIQIVCATIAFGMGIDKSNVRFVIHYNLPKNLESYYQEIGRAGRDGQPSDTLLFYSFADVMNLREMINSSNDEGAQASPEQIELRLKKLERLQQYAESHACRRRVLLTYFNEAVYKDCGNCDVCSTPRQTFDGTVIAQKALSAVMRTNERVAAGLLIDILRGMKNAPILKGGYDQIKTYGVGREHTTADWQQYIIQLVNLGLLDVAYDEHNALKMTEAGKAVLYQGAKVNLVQVQKIFAEKSTEKAAREQREKVKTKTEVLQDILFERLVDLRKRLADEQNIPPYQVFSDETLRELADQHPTDRMALANISGMSARKIAMYGSDFVNEIMEFCLTEGKGMRGVSSPQLTWHLWQQGKTVDEIAQQRSFAAATIVQHLVSLHEQGYDVDFTLVIAPEEIAVIKAALKNTPREAGQLKPVFEALNGQYDYGKLKLVETVFLNAK